MSTIVIDVMPKPEVLDPQGKAIAARFAQLGFSDFSDARQGKRFELTLAGDVTDEALAQARKLAEELLANPSTEYIASVREA